MGKPAPSRRPPGKILKQNSRYVAVLGGEGAMPWRILEGIRAQGKKVFLIAVPDLTDPALADASDDVLWIRHPKLARVKRECHKRAIRELALVGRIPHNRLFTLTPWHMDWTALRLFLTLPDFRADTILKGLLTNLSAGIWN